MAPRIHSKETTIPEEMTILHEETITLPDEPIIIDDEEEEVNSFSESEVHQFASEMENLGFPVQFIGLGIIGQQNSMDTAH